MVNQGSVKHAGQLLDVANGVEDKALVFGFQDDHQLARWAFLMQFGSREQHQVAFHGVQQLRAAMHKQAGDMQSVVVHFFSKAPPALRKAS